MSPFSTSETISIRAPLAGCDEEATAMLAELKDFNPRTPCGVRQSCKALNVYGGKFQSAHPLRGATLPCPAIPRRRLHFNPRTPCGVRLQIFLKKIPPIAFQSAHPLRGATPLTNASARSNPFQSAHPLRGATSSMSPFSTSETISIRAPLAGCDLLVFQLQIFVHHFNPRTPCGVRRVTGGYESTRLPFQSAHPLRGATLGLNVCAPVMPISIRAPLAGCDAAEAS